MLNRAGDNANTTTDKGLATVGGGLQNTASGFTATVGGGAYNSASGEDATVSGGDSNSASGEAATIPGGNSNTASGDYSFAAGRRAKATKNGSFVWGDSTEADFTSTAVDQFLIRASGGVGIGTTSPVGNLEIQGEIDELALVVIDQQGTDNWEGLRLDRDGTESWFMGMSNIDDKLRFRRSDSSNDMVIDTAGKVGIGTASPQVTLQVHKPGTTASDSSYARFSTGDSGESSGMDIGYTHDEKGVVLVRSNKPLAFYTNNTERMHIQADGDVGIGTTTPAEKLEVSGGNIRVSGGSFIDDGTTLNVPDYVFEPDYDLMSLDELSTYVSQEKHLPNVPSQKEIKTSGLNMSQFQMQLLEKVEELTLYTLAQQEQIRALQKEIKVMKRSFF